MLRILTATCISATLLFTGCTSRQNEQVELEELRSDRERLRAEVNALSKENMVLAQQRDSARSQLQEARGQQRGIEMQLKNMRGIKTGQGLRVSETGDSVILDQDFAFKKGSAELNDQAVKSLSELAKMLSDTEYADTLILIEGHTDNVPVSRHATKQRFGDNWGLSAMRSASVVRALVQAGIAPDRVRGAFRGEHVPREENKGKKGNAANRRVEIYLQLP